MKKIYGIKVTNFDNGMSIITRHDGSKEYVELMAKAIINAIEESRNENTPRYEVKVVERKVNEYL